VSRKTAIKPGGVGPARVRRRSSEVRLALARSARQVFEQRGYGGATTREIADHAGVNEVLIFRHFTNKATLFAETVYEPFARLLEGLLESELSQPAGADELQVRQRFVGRMITTLRDNRSLVMAVVNAHAYDRSLAEIPPLDRYFAASLERVLQTEIGRTSDPAMLGKLLRCGFAAVVGSVLLEDWILPNQFADERERLSVLTHFVDYGMYGGPDQPVSATE
jgi:AcrR family transcriptional regulator